MLNHNQYLKVEDSGFPLSCNAVKLSFQIKRSLFDLPNIVFSPFRGWKRLVLSLIGLPSSSLRYTHIYIQYKYTWLLCSVLCVMGWSGLNTGVPRPENTDNLTKGQSKLF